MKNKTKAKTNRNTTVNKTCEMAKSRLEYLHSLLSGERGLSGSRRLRGYRVEGTLSVRDAFRMEAFLSDLVKNEKVSRTTFDRLSSEVPEFTQILTPQLENRILAIIA